MHFSREHGAERKILNKILIVGDEGDEGEEMLVAKVLLLCCSFVKRGTEGMELTIVQYMEYAPPLDAVGETLG